MAQPQNYQRDKNGSRFLPGGIDTVHPYDTLAPNKYAYLQNVRGYKQNQIVGRATVAAAAVTGLATPIHSLRVLNDSTPLGPVAGYVRIIGAAGNMYVNGTEVGTGYSANPVSLCAFRPNASVQPWMYIGDSSQAVTITTEFLINGSPTTFGCFGATKIRSDGLIFKTGIAEPQAAPAISTSGTTTTGTDILPATAIPWTNVGGQNPDYNYGQNNAADGTAPIIITGDAPELIAGATITLTVTGTADVGPYGTVGPAHPGNTTSSYPGSATGITGSPAVVLGAFTDSSGNVIAPGGSLPLVFFIGAGITVTVPSGATQLQIGVDSSANTFSANSGNYTVDWSVTVNAVATVISTIGNVTAYVWGTPPPAGGGSPHTGPVGDYIWKNPNDSGSGVARSLTNPVPDASPTNNSWQLQAPSGGPTQPVNWDVLNPDGSVASDIDLYNPELESEGFQDFNCCIVGSIFVPAAGTYHFILQYKDQIMFGINGGATAVVTGGAAAVPPSRAQTITVINSLPILFVGGGTGGSDTAPALTTDLDITFAASGVYQVELDWDYWDKHQATLIMQVTSTSPNSPTIPPLPQNVRTDVTYRYVYRSSATGALSNPSPESTLQDTPVLANTVTPIYSTDPQVDKVDYYRMDSGLDNFTYVATGPNTNPPTPITDELSDTEVLANPLLQFDNFEPFPVTDLPKKGVINVTGGIITWVSGDQFNTRWLPGTDILIGSPTSLAYVFVTRPVSATEVVIPGVPDGTNLAYEIPEPTLAAQPLPYLWGPTDNTGYYFAVGDLLNPGTLYFTKGNNPDSAPQTNQIAVTSPSEPLMNGVITAGVGMVFSTERRWLIYPTFTTALATVEGVEGTPFNLVLASSLRGLYIANCVCTDGGNTTFFRGKDGIYLCEFGGPDQFICDDIYNLFPREGFTPEAVVIAGNTIFPPDDTRPTHQTMSFAYGYLYYDYEDVNGDPRTLVYDIIAKGWSVDVGEFPFTRHAPEEGPLLNSTMVGCTDGTVRELGDNDIETCTSIVLSGVQNAGEARALKRLGDVYIQALINASNPITVALYSNRLVTALTGFAPTSITGTGALSPYIIDFTSGFADDLIDVGISLNWPTISGNILDLWQPDFIFLPESTQDRPTDWDDGGYGGNKFVQGMIIEADTFNNAKEVTVQLADNLSIVTPNESPIIYNGQSIKPLTFTPPFLAHSMRIVTTDGVPWRMWNVKWVFKPFPESTIEWQTELLSLGQVGWFHLRECNIPLISTTVVVLTLTFDQWPTITVNIPSTASAQIKNKFTLPANKTKLVGFRLSSTAPFYPFQADMEFKIKSWGSTSAYEIIKPFGGETAVGAEV